MASIDISAFREYETRGLLTCQTDPTGNLLIWNYTPQCQYEQAWDDITIQARGLITTSDGVIVARPFKKFFNLDQHQGDLPSESFTVTAKMDGSLGILYFLDGKPQIATRGSFTSDQAMKANEILSEKYGTIVSLLQPDYTYLFEILYPTNRIVVDYGSLEDLVLLAVIQTETGEEVDINANDNLNAFTGLFPIVKNYDGINDIAQLRAIEEANAEGFVIRFQSGLRLKLKFEAYKRLHAIITKTSSKTIWEALANGEDLSSLFSHVPDEFAEWAKNIANDLCAAKDEWINKATREFSAIPRSDSRKAFALAAMQSPMKAALFALLDNKPIDTMAWKAVKPEFARPFCVEDNAL